MLALVAAVFARALAGDFVYDDVPLIVRSPALHDPADIVGLWTRPLWGEQLGNWRPLTSQLLALGWWLGDGTPWAIHAMALLLHLWATSTVLRLWRDCGGSVESGIAVALVFALHPAQAESVAWCSAINDVLVGACTLAGTRRWLCWRRGGRRSDLAMALGLAVAAMAAKEAGVVVPAVYVGIEIWLGPAAVQGRRRAVAAGAALALLPLWYLARVAVFGELAAGLNRAAVVLPGSTALLMFDVATGLGARLVAPFGHSMFDPVAGVGALDVVFAAALVAGVAAVLLVSSNAARTFARIGALFMGASLMPAILSARSLGPYPLADRYLYVGVAGLALLVAAALARKTRARTVLLAAVAAVFAVATSMRLDTWSDAPTFVQRSLERQPDDPRLHYMQGQLLLERAGGGDAAALGAAQQALMRARSLLGGDARRDHLSVLRRDVATALAWCRWLAESKAPRPDWTAVERQFLQVTNTWPEAADGWVGLGVVRGATGRLDAAELALRRALEIDPGTSAAHHNLARVLWQRGDRRGARRHLEEALRLWPGDLQSRELLRQLDADLRSGGR